MAADAKKAPINAEEAQKAPTKVVDAGSALAVVVRAKQAPTMVVDAALAKVVDAAPTKVADATKAPPNVVGAEQPPTRVVDAIKAPTKVVGAKRAPTNVAGAQRASPKDVDAAPTSAVDSRILSPGAEEGQAPPQWADGALYSVAGLNFAPPYPTGAIIGYADGFGNNCLIHSLAQILRGPMSDGESHALRGFCASVRASLVAKYSCVPPC